MKTLLGLLATILIFTNTTQACEAQVSGTVRTMTKTQIKGAILCTVKINYISFQPAALCSMNVDDFKDKEVATKYCDRNVDDHISGYLMEVGDGLYLDE